MLVSSLRTLVGRSRSVHIPEKLPARNRINGLIQHDKLRFAVTRFRRNVHVSSPKNAAPLIPVLIKTVGIKVMKGVSIVFGRSFRKLYERLPENVRAQVGKHRIVFSVGGILLPFVGYYSYTHYEECPITGRKRWITFTKEQLTALADLEYEQLMGQFEGKLLPPSHDLYQKNAGIVAMLIHANSDIDAVKNTDWMLHVIDDPTVTNAFVLPNGHIFVFTGMLKMLNTWQEMSIILGHEMSHAILGHSQEQQSYLAFGEVLTVPLLAFIWFFFDDFAAFLIYTIESYIYPLVFEYGFHRPYSRRIETEADEVGLMLSSKTCIDPRWSVLLWEKMAFQQAISDEADTDKFEYLSTHPGNQKRSAALEKLLPRMLEIRKSCNCPDLPTDVDPQAAARHMRQCVANIKQRKELSVEIEEQVSLLEKKRGVTSDNQEINKAATDKLQEKLDELQRRLKQLEEEYSVLVSGPKTSAEDTVAKNGSLFSRMWQTISGRIAVSGKLSNTLFEDQKIQTVTPIQK